MKIFKKVIAFTMADRLSRSYTLRSKLAFTMAEILISLTIIGVIAAITLPALRANINESTWNTQRKALYSRMSQAISMMPTLNGYGIGATDEETASIATEAFITNGLSKVLKIKNICDNDNLSKCGISNNIKSFSNNNFSTFPRTIYEFNPTINKAASNVAIRPPHSVNTNVAAMETINGESIAVFYNPYCVNSELSFRTGTAASGDLANQPHFYMFPYMCANFVYDLNGLKGPNKVGKDIGIMTAVYPTESILAMPVPKNISQSMLSYNDAKKYCRNLKLKLPNIAEGISLEMNYRFLDLDATSGRNAFWLLEKKSSNYAWLMVHSYFFASGIVIITRPFYVLCIER